MGEEPRPAASEQTLRDVLSDAGWEIASLEPATVPDELDGTQAQMAFWYLRAQRRRLSRYWMTAISKSGKA